MNDAIATLRPVDRSEHEILVVDDDPVSRYTTVRWLQSAGFKTREATTGAEALKLADGGISAMVLDVHLPDIDGFELCGVLRSRSETARLPVLHLSAAYVTDEDKVKGLDSGADSYLTHPVDPAVLVASVQALVRARVAEEAMRRSETQFKAIYARVPSGICLLDKRGRLVDANPAMLQFLGARLAEVKDRQLSELVPAEWKQRAAALLSGPENADESRDEFPVVNAAGRVMPLQWTMVRDVQPGLDMALATDVSERTALEEQRQQALLSEREARGTAERLSRLKDEFIAVLSHELRTPLTAIKGWVQILRRRGDEPTRLRGLEAIERNVQVQSKLVSDLLDMSSIQLGKMRLTLEPTNVVASVQAVVMAFAQTIEEKALLVNVESRGSTRLVVHADPARVHQILSNLLGNAIKFSPPGAHIDVTVQEKDGGALISFADHGKGIEPDFLPRLFDRFSQADAGSNRQHGGLGLGLSIVRHLVESHDGTVSVESAGLNQGATFHVWLPESGPSGESGSMPLEPPGASEPYSPEASLTGLRLLVVDDDPDICGALQIILGDRGARVETAHDFDTALGMLSEPIDVLISDVGMPGKDGYALLREIRNREGAARHLPAIALTSYVRDRDKADARDAGFDDHCAKPIQPLQLIHKILRLVRS